MKSSLKNKITIKNTIKNTLASPTIIKAIEAYDLKRFVYTQVPPTKYVSGKTKSVEVSIRVLDYNRLLQPILQSIPTRSGAHPGKGLPSKTSLVETLYGLDRYHREKIEKADFSWFDKAVEEARKTKTPTSVAKMMKLKKKYEDEQKAIERKREKDAKADEFAAKVENAKIASSDETFGVAVVDLTFAPDDFDFGSTSLPMADDALLFLVVRPKDLAVAMNLIDSWQFNYVDSVVWNRDFTKPGRLNCKTILQHITDELGKDGFHVHAKILDASFYGTAQARKRGIILCRRGQVWDFPAPDDKQLTCFDVIGDRKVYTMLDSSRMRDPDNEFHRIPYVSPVQEDFIRLIPSGEAAIKFFEKMGWSRSMVVNPNGTPSQAQHKNSAFARNSWNKPNHTIIQGSGSLCGDWTLHPGDLIGKDAQGRSIYSDPRPYSVAEIFALTGLDDNFIKAIPAWARPSDDLLRQLCGEALLPNLFNRCLERLKK